MFIADVLSWQTIYLELIKSVVTSKNKMYNEDKIKWMINSKALMSQGRVGGGQHWLWFPVHIGQKEMKLFSFSYLAR